MAADTPVLPRTRWCDGLAAFAERYDAFLVDQFGVLLHATGAYPGAADALRALRARGRRVIVLSNSGKRAAANAARLARCGIDAACYDSLLTSGELAWQLLRARDRAPFNELGERVLLLNPASDRALLAGLRLREVAAVAEADLLWLASLGEFQSPDTLRPLLEAAARRHVPLLCANPDLERLAAGGVQPSSGSVAVLYASLGGPVVWVGKPHALMYAACRERFAAWGARSVCAVGDSLEHDIGGGAAAGFDTCYIAGGLHAAQFAAAGAAGRGALLERLRRALPTPPPPPTWALETLIW